VPLHINLNVGCNENKSRNLSSVWALIPLNKSLLFLFDILLNFIIYNVTLDNHYKTLKLGLVDEELSKKK